MLLPSSVCQALLATLEKLLMPFKPSSASSCFLANNSRLLSNGRQVIKSPALPACSFASSAALYSVGALGAKTTSIFGNFLLKAGIIWVCQIFKSSLRQDSMLILVLSCDNAKPPKIAPVANKNATVAAFFISLLFVLRL